MTSKIPALAAFGLSAALLAGCSSAPEPVTTGGRPVPSATLKVEQPEASEPPAATAEPTPEPASEPEASSEDDDESPSNFVSQTLKGSSGDGRKVSVRVDALAPRDLKAYFDDAGAGEDFVYVMTTCEDRCSLADAGPMKLIGSEKEIEALPVAGLGEREGPIFDVAPVAADGGAQLPANGQQIEPAAADALWSRATAMADKYRLGSGEGRRVYVVEPGQLSGKITEVQIRIGRQTVKLAPVL